MDLRTNKRDFVFASSENAQRIAYEMKDTILQKHPPRWAFWKRPEADD